ALVAAAQPARGHDEEERRQPARRAHADQVGGLRADAAGIRAGRAQRAAVRPAHHGRLSFGAAAPEAQVVSQAIAVIPARGGSKRIPRKNVRDFCGKPMIAWPIEELRAARLFDHIVVSTDDAEIAATAKKCGAEVPFSRPRELADDQASTDSVLLHALTECQRIYGAIERGCCVYPTTPFLAVADLRAGLDLLLANRATSAFPVVRYDFPIEQAFVLEGARPVARWPEKLAAR